jgi:hypothetical protein
MGQVFLYTRKEDVEPEALQQLINIAESPLPVLSPKPRRTQPFNKLQSHMSACHMLMDVQAVDRQATLDSQHMKIWRLRKYIGPIVVLHEQIIAEGSRLSKSNYNPPTLVVDLLTGGLCVGDAGRPCRQGRHGEDSIGYTWSYLVCRIGHWSLFDMHRILISTRPLLSQTYAR